MANVKGNHYVRRLLRGGGDGDGPGSDGPDTDMSTGHEGGDSGGGSSKN